MTVVMKSHESKLLRISREPCASPPCNATRSVSKRVRGTYIPGIYVSGTFSALVFSQSSSVLEKLCRVPGSYCAIIFPGTRYFVFGICTRLGTDAGM